MHHECARTAKLERDKLLTLPCLNQGVYESKEHIKAMSNREMEKALNRHEKRPQDHIHGQSGVPQSARHLLEENKELVREKHETKALARVRSREFVEKILADDRIVNEADKAKDIGRRIAQRGLATYYKAKICQKEVEKSNAYQAKVDGGVAIQFFPFVEGETISHNRKVEASKMRDEMQVFLKKQQEKNPQKEVDALRLDADPEYQHRYPFMPVYSQSARGPPPPWLPLETAPEAPTGAPLNRGSESARDPGDVAPHLKKYPKFLCKAREHMSRRIHDTHVRKALEDKVERTKEELAKLTRRRERESEQWEDGMAVNDALRYDGARVKVEEREKNAVYLKKQVQERRDKEELEKLTRRAEPAGYYGPEEKGLRDVDTLRQNCQQLIHQMEVNQMRRLDSRSRRLAEEKQVIENSIADMSLDRVKEREKLLEHKDILKTTWESQRKIRQVKDRIDKL